MRRLLRWLAWLLPALWASPAKTEKPQAGTDTQTFDASETIHTAAPGMTHLTPALVGIEQRADGSWRLVLATLDGAGLPDGEQITPQQAMRIARLLRQVRMDGGL